MYDKPQIEIPETMRDMAERNVEQARTAYQQFMNMARQAQDMVVKSSGALTEATLEIQTRAMKFAEQNMDAGFAAAQELAKARDLKEYFDTQTRHTQKQAQAYVQQAQELGRLMADAAQKAGPKT
ncbi:MAG: phasin family protein [Hyphomicrobiaceae bacterium]